MKNSIVSFLSKTKNYAFVTGVIFFAIGLFGFIFKSSSSISGLSLIGFLLVGGWGILVSFSKTE